MNVRVAIPYDKGAICRYFGNAELFKLYTLADGEVKDFKFVACGDIVKGRSAVLWFVLHEVDVVICDGIGYRLYDALKAAGIQVLSRRTFSADEAIKSLLAGMRRDAL